MAVAVAVVVHRTLEAPVAVEARQPMVSVGNGSRANSGGGGRGQWWLEMLVRRGLGARRRKKMK